MTTLDQFRATGRDCADLGDALKMDMGVEHPVAGRLYADSFYIEDCRSWEHDPATPQGRWCLTLERNPWMSDDLAALERRLYLWVLDESPEWRGALVDAAINAACKSIQDAIGQTDGGTAGMFFAGENVARDRFANYLYEEIREWSAP